jgi:acetylornithine deacetylase
VGEETDGAGMKFFSAGLAEQGDRLRGAVFGEPTEGRLACGHKGIALGRVQAVGRAGHSGYPWLGKSAVGVLVRGLGALLDADLGTSARFGNTTVNVGVVEGGVAANVIAKEASAQLAVRVAVGNRTTGLGIVRERMERVLREVDGEGLRLELDGGYGPVECECRVDGEFFLFFLFKAGGALLTRR